MGFIKFAEYGRRWTRQVTSFQKVSTQAILNVNEKLFSLLETQKKSKEEDNYKCYSQLAIYKPRSYDGEIDPIKFENWIAYIEKLLDIVECPAHLRVKYASFYFEGLVEMWQNTIKDLPSTVELTKEAFLKLLRERFYPPSLQSKLELEFLQLK